MISANWQPSNFNLCKTPSNKEIVTVRANIYNKKIRLRISIGLIICELLDFNKDDRVNVFLNKNDKNTLLIKRSLSLDDGYKLVHTQTSNFLNLDIRLNFYTEFKIKQTIKVGYEIEENYLLVDMTKLKWKN